MIGKESDGEKICVNGSTKLNLFVGRGDPQNPMYKYVAVLLGAILWWDLCDRAAFGKFKKELQHEWNPFEK
jgi:hypothetical protein